MALKTRNDKALQQEYNRDARTVEKQYLQTGYKDKNNIL